MAKDRTVTFTLKVDSSNDSKKVFDDAIAGFKATENAAKAASAAAKQAKDSIEQIKKANPGRDDASATSRVRGMSSFSAGLKAAEANAAAERRERERYLNELARAAEIEKKINADRIRSNVAASQAVRDAAKATRAERAVAREDEQLNKELQLRREVARFEKEQNAERKRAATEQSQFARDYEQASRRQAQTAAKAWKETRQAAMAATEGAVMYGRAIVLAIAADDESSERALRNIARFQAFSDLLFGTIRMIDGGTKAWRAYQSAASAAAAASALASYAGSASSARGAAGGVVSGAIGGMAGGSGSIGALAAGAAATIKGAIVLVGGAIVSATGLLATSAAVSAAKGRDIASDWKSLGEMIWGGTKELLGFSDMAGDAAKRWEQSVANMRRRDEFSGRMRAISGQSESERRSLYAEMLPAGSQQRVAFFDAERRAATMAANDANLGYGVDVQRRQAEAAQRVIDVTTQQIAAMRERADAEIRTNRDRIDSERSVISELERERDSRRQTVKELENAKLSAAERFGRSDAAAQRGALESVRRAEAGLPLSREQIDYLRIVDPIRASQKDIENANKNGFAEIAAILDKRIAVARAEELKVSAQIDLKNEVIMKLEANEEAIAKSLADSVNKLVKEVILPQLSARTDAEMRQLRAQEILQNQ